jgi:chromosomal replication initiator protein
MFQDNKIIISVPNVFTKTWFEKKYHEDIKKTLQKLTSLPQIDLIYKVEPRYTLNNNIIISREPAVSQENINEINEKIEVQQRKEAINKFGLNPKYIFETFIVGKGNELAHAACQAAAARPGKAYNPLYLYGGVGLGKTHLLHAVGHEIIRANPEAKVIYVACEKFTNDYVLSVRRGKMDEFREKYRKVDLLLIDDIQFISGKEGTAEEFFHTFNSLHQSDKQIIISADRPPKGIPDLEQRLLSRFEWGMTADILAPDLETRIAILESKCQEKKYNLDKRIIQYIAVNIQNNIRELEGVLTKIIAYHQLRNAAPSFEIIKNIVSGFVPNKTKKNITTKHLFSAICDFYNIEIQDLLSETREKKISLPRQILMYLMREELKSSLPSIGKELGGRDHTTVLHACKKIGKELENNLQMKQELETLKQNIYNSITVG